MFEGKYNIKIFGAIVFVLFYATSLMYLAYNSISHAKKNLWKKDILLKKALDYYNEKGFRDSDCCRDLISKWIATVMSFNSEK